MPNIQYHKVNSRTADAITRATSDVKTPDLDLHVNIYDMTNLTTGRDLKNLPSLTAVISQDEMPVLALVNPEDAFNKSGRFNYERFLILSDTAVEFKEALSDVTQKLHNFAQDMLDNDSTTMTALEKGEALPVSVAAGTHEKDFKKTLKELGYKKKPKEPYWAKKGSNVDFKFV